MGAENRETDASGGGTDAETVSIFSGGSITDYKDYFVVKPLNTTAEILQMMASNAVPPQLNAAAAVNLIRIIRRPGLSKKPRSSEPVSLLNI